MPRFKYGLTTLCLLLLTILAASPPVLAQGSAVSGTATLDGAAAAGVDVLLSSGVDDYTATTDDDGAFAFEGVAPGTYYLFPAGGGEVTLGGFSSGDVAVAPVFVEDGADIEGLALDLETFEPLGFNNGIYGGVYDASTGQPFNFVALIFEIEDEDGPVGTTITFAAPSGFYILSQLDPGTYTVTVTAIDLGDGSGSEVGFFESLAADVEITDGAPAPLVLAFTPLPSGTLAGTVTLDGEAEGYSASLAAIPVDGGDGVIGNVIRSVGIGTPYSFDFPADEYYILVQLSFGSSVVYSEFFDGATTVASADIVTIAEDQTTGGIDFTLPIPDLDFTITINGTVTTTDGDPIEAAVVVAENLAGTGFAATLTDENGEYTILTADPSFASSEVVVKAGAIDFEVEYYDDQPTFFLADILPTGTESTTFENIDFDLVGFDDAGEGFTISGTVLDDETNAPIEGALVVATRTDFDEAQYGWTDVAGTYRVDDIDAGEWVVLFAEEDYEPGFYPDVPTWLDAEPVAVTGDLPGINARLGGLNRPVGTSRPDELENWPTLDGLLEAARSDGPLAEVAARGGAGARATGIVRDEEGAPLPGVLVVAEDANGGATEFAFTGPDGVYHLDGLGTTTVALRAEEVGREVATAEVSFPQGTGNAVASFALSPQSPVSTDDAAAAPEALDLIVYPNPVSSAARVAFVTRQEEAVTLRLYDTLGRVVQTVVDGRWAAGAHTADLDVEGLAAGVYFLRLTADGNVTTRPLTIVR